MITVLFLSYTAYRFYDFSSIGLCLYLILFYRLYYPSYHLIILGIYLCYIMISYVNYKFDEILKSLRLSILWNNKRGIFKNIIDHHNLVVITQQFSYLMNSIIGLIHSIIPYIMVLVIKIIMLPTIPGYLKYYFIVLIITYIAFIYSLNLLCASVTVRNKNAPKQFYRVFSSYKFIDLKTRLKIISMLEKLTSVFIGFYCFNMYKFTKISFYTYFITITSAYILVSKIQ